MVKDYNNAFEKWEAFCNYLRKDNRFILTKEWKDFIKSIIDSASKREKKIEKGKIFWRAKIGQGPKVKGDDIVDEILSVEEISPPLPEKCFDGRANPRGIPYLYLAEDKETAIAEIRPYINASITFGLFELKEDIKVIDVFENIFSLYNYIEKKKSGKTMSCRDENELLWWAINLYYSVPVKPEDKYFSYLPCQYLSELFKNKRYDGIIYGSAQRIGEFNLVLFNHKLASLIRREQGKVYDVDYIIDPIEFHKRNIKSKK